MTQLWLSAYYDSMDIMSLQVANIFPLVLKMRLHILVITCRAYFVYLSNVLCHNWYHAGVFKKFEKDGEFFSFTGQSTEAVTGMYDLNKASQISFPGEDVLQRARAFSYRFLREREAQGTVRDKWIIAKDLPGEVIKSMLALDQHRCINLNQM